MLTLGKICCIDAIEPTHLIIGTDKGDAYSLEYNKVTNNYDANKLHSKYFPGQPTADFN